MQVRGPTLAQTIGQPTGSMGTGATACVPAVI